ncbi:MAG: hypothetical protein OJF60_001157 [Burkholderiaceae bacterium]|jgi:hypothetical protein|nr:MAG: hypothetical protein OJF60_001157 [Burkholderiaceae bacterium]
MMLMQILIHTPLWVFALFLLLLWLGLRQLLTSQLKLSRVTLLPLAMVGLSLYGVASAFGRSPGGPSALAGWAVGVALLAAIVLLRPLPAGVRYDAARRRFIVPGSVVPLALMMGIFFTKYVVGVKLALDPALAQHADFALVVGTLYGAFSGTFAARAARLWRLALRSEHPGALRPGV